MKNSEGADGYQAEFMREWKWYIKILGTMRSEGKQTSGSKCRRYREVDSLRRRMKKWEIGNTQVDIRWKFDRLDCR